MYPNLYYAFKDWFGVNWKALGFLNTFGLMVAIAFVVAAIVLTSELKRKEKQGLLFPREESITVGRPASVFELLLNFFAGFIFAYKLVGLFINKADDINAQDYIFSRDGNILAGVVAGGLLAFLKWKDANKQKLKEPEQRMVRIWPHDRVGDIIILGLVFGILGAKLFDGFENWNDFVQHPIERIFSTSGLTFYGGLIVAAIAICWYAYKRGIKLVHLIDSAAPALMIAYAIGRIGCQVSGDGDWGIYNSAYITDSATAKVISATPQQFRDQVQAYNTYFLSTDSSVLAEDERKSANIASVPNKAFSAPSFLPTWMVAYNFPQNVNKDGIKIPGCVEDHDRVLPIPVFPTSFYETVACSLLFLFLWSIRKRIKLSGIIFGIYLILNGLERFFIEKIRVNNKYHILGLNPTQAEIISFLLIIIGLILVIAQSRKKANIA